MRHTRCRWPGPDTCRCRWAGEDYIELLPACWRAINDYGIVIGHRTYDCPDLGPYRRTTSPVAAMRGRWEVHYDPYDLSRVWVRDQASGGWVTVPWTQLPMVAARSPTSPGGMPGRSWPAAAAMTPTRPPSHVSWPTCCTAPRAG